MTPPRHFTGEFVSGVFKMVCNNPSEPRPEGSIIDFDERIADITRSLAKHMSHDALGRPPAPTPTAAQSTYYLDHMPRS